MSSLPILDGPNSKAIFIDPNKKHKSCDSKNKKGFFKTLKNGFKSKFLKYVINAFLLLLIINLLLIFYGQFGDDLSVNGRASLSDKEAQNLDPNDTSLDNKLTDQWTTSLGSATYFTSTQFTTVGYGDLSPKTVLGKGVTTFTHLVVLWITLRLMDEFKSSSKLAKELDEIKQSLEQIKK